MLGIPDGQTLNGAQHWLAQFADIFSDFVISGGLGSVPGGGGSLTMVTPQVTAYANGRRMVSASAGDSKLFTINQDTYVDVSQYGVFTYTAVANAGAAPGIAANSIRLEKVITDGTKITTVTDLRTTSLLKTAGVGYLGIPQNSQSGNYTTVLADAGKHLLHPTADNNPRTFTIDSNANVAFAIGTAITFINEINTLTIAITTDTLVFAGTGGTGSRTLGSMGIATAVKKTTTSWIISGTGLT